MMAEALPTLLMLLPAAQGALTLSLCTYADYLRDVGVNVPYNLPAALALITTASLAALARYLEHGISGEEYEVCLRTHCGSVLPSPQVMQQCVVLPLFLLRAWHLCIEIHFLTLLLRR